MFRMGEAVKWMCPLDADYSYGTILEIKNSIATVLGSGYYKGNTAEVHIRYITKAEKGGGCYGGSKKHRKHTAIKFKLQRS